MIRTRVGYCGGTKENPTYRGLGDHTESIQIDYDPSKISYRELINIFWENHSPDYKMDMRQYMSIVFYHNEEQKEIALETKKEYEERFGREIYTEIEPIKEFYLAEGYHQKYYLRRVRELMSEFEKVYPKMKDFMNSNEVARVNGYIKGYGTMKGLQNEIKELGLSEHGEKRLTQIVEGYGKAEN